MIPIEDFKQTAYEKLLDAQCLLEGDRYAGSVYLAGYALEIALKVKLCNIHELIEFPENQRETNAITKKWFKHNLEKLEGYTNLNLNFHYTAAWLKVKNWDVEARYKRLPETQEDSTDFFNSIQILLNALLGEEL